MTKPTQKQRREKNKQCKQTHNNSDNHKSHDKSDNHESHVSGHEEFVSSNIKIVYPNVNIINMTDDVFYSTANVISNVEKLNEFTKEDNNIIIVFNINTLMFTNFYSRYMLWKKVPTAVLTTVKDTDNKAFMIVRGGHVILYPTSALDADTMSQILKSQLKLRVKECLICFHELVFNEKRVSCCNCQMPLCEDCFNHYIKENPGWCPYCTQHLMYYGLGKRGFKNDEVDNLFDEFVGEQMRASLIQTPFVRMLPAKPLADKLLSFLQMRVSVT